MSGTALHLALDLMNRPVLAGAMREQPVPPGILPLIQIAAGDEGALDAAGKLVPEPPVRIREASILYLQHILFTGADHYRALGVERSVPHEQLREHFVWLMKWLHPDRTETAWESAFAERVLAAWETLKTPERRAAYDRTLPRPDASRRARPKVFRPAHSVPWIRQRTASKPSRYARGAALLAAGLVLGLVVWSGQQRFAVDSADETGSIAAQVPAP